ncbi:MAG: ATP-binding protein [Pseudomonadota bacterium]
MQIDEWQNKINDPQILLSIGLIALSLLCVAFMMFAFGEVPKNDSLFFLNIRILLLIGVIGGVLSVTAVAAVFFLQGAQRAYKAEAQAASQVSELQKKLHSLEAILNAEPQLLMFWDTSGEPSVITNNLLQGDTGIPSESKEIVSFRSWLEPDSAVDLESALEQMFKVGQAFNIMLKTLVGAELEADGRTVGGRIILKFRDVAGWRAELSEMSELKRRMKADAISKQTLLDAIPMPIWFRDGDGRLSWVNHSYVKLVNAQSLESVTKKQIELLEKRQRVDVVKALAQGQIYRSQHHTVVGDDRYVFDTIALPLGSESAGIAIDVAALESAKGELDQHIAAHARTLDRVSTAVAIFGPDMRLNFFNQAYVDIWGLDPVWLETGAKDGEILDKLRTLRILPEQADYQDWKQKQLEGYASNDVQEDWWYLPDSRAIHVVSEQRPDGGVTYLYDDATERIALESRYNALFHVQKETLENLREGVAVFGTDGRLKLFNKSYAQIWKLNSQDLDKGLHIERIIDLCSILHEDDRSWGQIKRAVTSISETRQPLEGQLNRLDGSIIAYACLPLPDGATLLTYVDMTDTKRAELMLVERNEALEAAGRLKNDFIQSVSYELRTPLTNIIGFADLLINPAIGFLNDRQKDYLSDISASSSTLLAIINDILDLATIDAGTFEMKLERVKVADVIKSAALGVRERLVRTKLGLDIRVEPGIDDFICDQKRAIQILYNLLSNAIGFSPQGSRIRLLCTRDQDHIAFTVVDQGCGIPEDEQNLVFDRFESRSQGSKHRGTGLGLSLAKSLVDLHGGDIKLKSKSGKGTIVIVRFPEKGSLKSSPHLATPEASLIDVSPKNYDKLAS